MKNNKMDLLKIGIVVPALVISLAACGSANSDAGKSAEAPATEAQAQEAEAEKEAEAIAADQRQRFDQVSAALEGGKFEEAIDAFGRLKEEGKSPPVRNSSPRKAVQTEVNSEGDRERIMTAPASSAISAPISSITPLSCVFCKYSCIKSSPLCL